MITNVLPRSFMQHSVFLDTIMTTFFKLIWWVFGNSGKQFNFLLASFCLGHDLWWDSLGMWGQ